jgi:segregation and condensation protein B
MPISQQPPQNPETELTEEAANLPSLNEGESAPASEIPFASAEHDPGIEDLVDSPEEEAEATMAEPVVYRELTAEELEGAVEATLFMHHKPLSLNRIRELVNPAISEEDYRTAVSNLMGHTFSPNRGIELVEVANGYIFRTKQEHKDIVRRVYQIAPMKLTNAMLEVLAIAAYNQPITREGIDKVRGVDSSHLLRVLLDKKMLRIVGKSDEVGKPMLYGTTREFLEVFGLRDLSALPTLRELEEMLPKNEVGAEISEEELLSQEMEGILEASKPLEFHDLELDSLDEETQTGPFSTDRNPSPKEHSSSPEGTEARGGLDLPAEAVGHQPTGQEGPGAS